MEFEWFWQIFESVIENTANNNVPRCWLKWASSPNTVSGAIVNKFYPLNDLYENICDMILMPYRDLLETA